MPAIYRIVCQLSVVEAAKTWKTRYRKFTSLGVSWLSSKLTSWRKIEKRQCFIFNHPTHEYWAHGILLISHTFTPASRVIRDMFFSKSSQLHSITLACNIYYSYIFAWIFFIPLAISAEEGAARSRRLVSDAVSTVRRVPSAGEPRDGRSRAPAKGADTPTFRERRGDSTLRPLPSCAFSVDGRMRLSIVARFRVARCRSRSSAKRVEVAARSHCFCVSSCPSCTHARIARSERQRARVSRVSRSRLSLAFVLAFAPLAALLRNERHPREGRRHYDIGVAGKYDPSRHLCVHVYGVNNYPTREQSPEFPVSFTVRERSFEFACLNIPGPRLSVRCDNHLMILHICRGRWQCAGILFRTFSTTPLRTSNRYEI